MKKYFIAFSLLLASSLALGQTMETPVSFDSNGKMMEWTRKLESKAGLFPEAADFRSAVLWKADTVYTLEMTTAQGRMRKPLTAGGFDSLRQRVDLFFNTSGSSLALNQDGRGAYLLWQIPLSLGWYGPAVVTLLNPDDGSTATGLYMLSASFTYYLPFMITKNSPITSGQEHLSIAYGFRGIAAGGALSNLLGTDDHQVYAGIMLASSISGQVAGFQWGKNFTKPQGRIISHYATFGMTDLPLFAAVFQEDPKEKLMSASVLAGLAGGTYLGYRLAKGKNVSDGEPTIVATSGWTGMAAGAGLYLTVLAKKDGGDLTVNERALCSFCLLGNAAGLYLGHRYTRGYSFTRGDGFIVTGSTVAGTLLGMGFGFLAHSDDPRVFMGISTLGMVGGYTIGINTVRNQEHKRLSSLDINLDGVPLGLAMVASKTTTKIPWITGSF